jgi:glycosyltransferase involved in cell wall biosynthesis
MKILMLHNRYQIPGGEDVSTHMQVELLRSAGHHVDLVEESNDRVDEIGAVRSAAKAIWSMEAHRTVGRLLDEDRYDLMHVQNFFPLLSPSVYYAARSAGVPVIQSLRNFRLVCPEGMLFRDGRACFDCVGKAVPWPSIAHACYRDSRIASSVVTAMDVTHRFAGTWRRMVDRYVTPSAFAAGIFLEAGWDPGSIEVIPNFIHPDPGVGSGNGGFALYAGRLARTKGIPTLLEAWEGLSHPLTIIGDGDLRPLVEDAARTNESITYLGGLPIDETLEMMGAARFIVAPTEGIETFGRVVAEAQAGGTPAIASDLGGLSEIVEDAVTGYLFPAGDARALRSRVAEMWDRAPGMRTAARTSFDARYSSAPALESWERLYEDVIGDHGP